MNRHPHIVPLVSGNLLHGVDGFSGSPGGVAFVKGHVHHRAAILIVILDFIHPDKILAGVDIHLAVAPENLIHPFHRLQPVLILLRLVEGYIPDHHPCRAGIAEFPLHYIQSLAGGGPVRQIFRQIVVDIYKQHRYQTQDTAQNKCGLNPSLPPDDKAREPKGSFFLIFIRNLPFGKPQSLHVLFLVFSKPVKSHRIMIIKKSYFPSLTL